MQSLTKYQYRFILLQILIIILLLSGIVESVSYLNRFGIYSSSKAYTDLFPATAHKAKVSAPVAVEGNGFGRTVAIENNTLVVGMPFDDSHGENSGLSYIFTRSQTDVHDWSEAKALDVSASLNDLFGRMVLIRGNTVFVGASYERTGRPDEGLSAGSAYIFDRHLGGTNNWGQQLQIAASPPHTDDRFGRTMSISGDTLAVGAAGHDDRGNSKGAVHIFERNGGGTNNWGHIKKLIANDENDWDFFGYATAIDGDTVVAGAYGDDDDGNRSGSAYIFERNQGGTNNWGQVAKITANDAAAGDWLGRSVAIDGDRVAVGATYKESEQGTVYIFERNQGGTNNWGQIRKITASDPTDGARFGCAISMQGDLLIISATAPCSEGDSQEPASAGAVYLFERDLGGTDNWGQVAKITASDGVAGDAFGISVDTDGTTLVVGAHRENGSGSVYIYDIAELLGEVNTVTPTPTNTETPTPTFTDTPTSTSTPTFTDTLTPTDTMRPTETPTEVPTATFTPVLTFTPTQTKTDTPIPTVTMTPVQTSTLGATSTSTDTPTLMIPTHTATSTSTDTKIPVVPTHTATPTLISTNPPTPTPTSTEVNGAIGEEAQFIYLAHIFNFASIPGVPIVTPIPTPTSFWQRIAGENIVFASVDIQTNSFFAAAARNDVDQTRNGLYRGALSECQATSFTQLDTISQGSVFSTAFQGVMGLAATEQNGDVHYTVDNGNSWTPTESDLGPRTYSVLFANNAAYAGSEDEGVFVSRDNGVRWGTIDGGPNNLNVLRNNGASLWLGTSGAGVWELTLDSHQYTDKSANLAGGTVWDIVSRTNNDIFIATANGVYRGNGQDNWLSLDSPKPPEVQSPEVLSLEIFEDVLYAGIRDSGVWRIDLATSNIWQKENFGANYTVRDLVSNLSSCNDLWAATSDGIWVLR